MSHMYPMIQIKMYNPHLSTQFSVNMLTTKISFSKATSTRCKDE